VNAMATASDSKIIEAALRDTRSASRGFVADLLDRVASGLGAEIARVQLHERQLSASAIGALESLIAEMESQHRAEVSALRAEMTDMRTEIEEAQVIAEGPPLRIVASAADAVTPPVDGALADLMQVVEQRGRVRALRAMMALLSQLLQKEEEAIADVDPGVEGTYPTGMTH
jgi:hypothetical protein